MTVTLHTSHEAEYAEKGYVAVSRADERVGMAHPDRTCLHPMRPWTGPDQSNLGYCLMDKDHRGRHATVVFWCDGCGKARRGEPVAYDRDVNGDVNAAFCFMCVRLQH